jgi:gliding motility-associated-like protein
VASVGSITVNATGNDAPFNFSFDGGTTYGVNTTAAGLAMGSYDIVVLNSWGCISDTTIYIAPPIPTITATVTDPSCGVNNGQIQAAVSSGTPAYQFSFNGGTTYQGSSLSSGHSGGSFTVIVVDAGGCSDTVTVTMESNAVPVVTVNSVTSPFCVGQSGCVDFSVGSGISPYTFDYGDGSTPGTATTYCGYDAGNYTITALGDNGCTGTATITVNAPDTVVAAFSATPTSGNPPLTVNFINGSTGATAYDWTFGNGNTSTTSDPTVEYITDGTYQVVLVASNANGCTDTATVTITVIGVSAMVVPNIITDNGDGANDAFRVEAENIDEFECTIYNRWGTMVYQYTDVNGSWDGENHVDGTYFYVIKALGRDGVQYDLNGTVTLMRP